MGGGWNETLSRLYRSGHAAGTAPSQSDRLSGQLLSDHCVGNPTNLADLSGVRSLTWKVTCQTPQPDYWRHPQGNANNRQTTRQAGLKSLCHTQISATLSLMMNGGNYGLNNIFINLYIVFSLLIYISYL